MRATATSCVKSFTVAHVRTAFCAVTLDALSVGVGPLPISAASTAPSDDDTMQWAHGDSGCIGVSINGAQPGSRVVASLPSRPLRMAVTGRQKLQGYLVAKTAMSALSMALGATPTRR